MTEWRDTVYQCILDRDFIFSLWWSYGSSANQFDFDELGNPKYDYSQYEEYLNARCSRYYGLGDDIDTVFSNRIIIW